MSEAALEAQLYRDKLYFLFLCVGGSAYGHSLNPEFSVCQSGVSRPPQEEVGKGPCGKGCRQHTKAPGNGPFFPAWKQGLKAL